MSADFREIEIIFRSILLIGGLFTVFGTGVLGIDLKIKRDTNDYNILKEKQESCLALFGDYCKKNPKIFNDTKGRTLYFQYSESCKNTQKFLKAHRHVVKYFGIDSTKIEKPFVIEDPGKIKKAAPKATFKGITKFIEELTDIN